jgi:hypothetical protein
MHEPLSTRRIRTLEPDWRGGNLTPKYSGVRGGGQGCRGLEGGGTTARQRRSGDGGGERGKGGGELQLLSFCQLFTKF